MFDRKRPSTDPIEAFTRRRGLDTPERQVALVGTVRLSRGARAAAALQLTLRGGVLVAASDADTGSVHALHQAPLRYTPGRWRDTVELGGETLHVARGDQRAARELVALARLRASSNPETNLPALTPRHVGARDAVCIAALGAWLEPAESPLALLGTRGSIARSSPLGHGLPSTTLWALSPERAALLHVSPLGDLVVEDLGRSPLRVERRLARAEVHTSHRVLEPDGNVALFEELQTATALSGVARALEVARVTWLAHRKRGGPELGYARRLIASSAREQVLGALLEQLVGLELGENAASRPPLGGVVQRLADAPEESPTLLGELWQGWAFSTSTAEHLLAELEVAGPRLGFWAVSLYGVLCDSRLERAQTELDAIAIDLAFAERARTAGAIGPLRQRLGRRLDALPPNTVRGLVSARSTATTERRLLAARVAIYDHLKDAAEVDPDGTPPLDATLVELARLEPLSEPRLRDVVERGSKDHAKLARLALDALLPGGLGRVAHTPPAVASGLSEEAIGGLLRHPAAREGSDVLSNLQALIATVEAPDASALRLYCEQLGPNQDAARGALLAAATSLGVDGIEGYVSRGRKDVGMRSYEGEHPFVLIGGRHLDPSDGLWLDPTELRFAIATEVAHLRLGHTRVTSSEVWAGALDRGREGFDVLVSALPLLRGWTMADRLSRATRPLQSARGRQLLLHAESAGRRVAAALKPTTPGTDEIGTANENLVAAHRVMQLTADRAGLLLTGAIAPALRAMLLMRTEYAQRLDEVVERGLIELLSPRSLASDPALDDLAARVGALVAFSLSPDYAKLRADLSEPAAAR